MRGQYPPISTIQECSRPIWRVMMRRIGVNGGNVYMADDRIGIRIVFKAGPAQPKCEYTEVQMTASELKRLESDLNAQQGYYGVYDAWQAGQVTRLIVRLSEVLFTD